jgi:putative DNA primase/helicase
MSPFDPGNNHAVDKIQAGSPASAPSPKTPPPFDPAVFANWDAEQALAGPGVQITVIENTLHDPLVKTYDHGPDGLAIKLGSRPLVAAQARAIGLGLGIDQTRELEVLRDKLARLKSHQCVVLAPMPGRSATRQLLYEAVRKELPKHELALDGDGPLARTMECFSYPSDKPAVVALDIDTKDMPADLQQKIKDAGGPLAVLAQVDPQWQECGYLQRPSSSSGVRNTRTGERTPAGACHVFTVVTDGGDAERYCTALAGRLVLAGYGFVVITETGEISLRTLFDTGASGRGERLWYVGEPVLFGDLELNHAGRRAKLRRGPRLDTQALARLDQNELAELHNVRVALETEVRVEANRVRAAYLERQGVSPEQAQQRAPRGSAMDADDGGRLEPEQVFQLDQDAPWPSGTRTPTGWDMLEHAEMFPVGKPGPGQPNITGADPIEPDYGGGHNLAVWYRRGGDRGLRCWSHAHHGRVFHLAYDAPDLVALASHLRAAHPADVPAQIRALSRAFEHYVPLDEQAGREALAAAGLPMPGVLDFLDPDDFAIEALIELLKREDYAGLARLRPAGVLFQDALAEASAVADLFDALPDNFDWDGLDARIDAAAAERAKDGPFCLPVIQLKDGELHRAADAAEAALAACTARPVLQRGGALVRPRLLPAKDTEGKDTLAPGLAEMNAAMLLDDLSQAACFQKFDKRAKKHVAADPPRQLAEMLLSRAGRWNHFPPVRGIITAPTLRPDGTMLHEPGYDRATGLYHMLAKKIRLHPALLGGVLSRQDALEALALLRELLSEFPFVGGNTGASFSVALSMIITAALRGAVPQAPFHLIRAPTRGSGKSYLVNVVAALVTGRDCPAVTAGGDGETELEKRIDAALLRAHPIFSLDNLVGEIKSDKLCVALSEPIVSVRVLGLSKLIDVEQSTFFVGTGNNCHLVGDLTRRRVDADLDPQMERPELRDFSGDPKAAVLADRGRYLSAALMIPRAYLAAGAPQRLTPLASFAAWSKFVREALVWLDLADPVSTLDAAYHDDQTQQNERRVVEAWATEIGVGKGVTAKELADAAEEVDANGACVRPQLRAALSEALCKSAAQSGMTPAAGLGQTGRSLGYWLRDVKGKVFGDLQITGAGDARSGLIWTLVRLAQP